MTSGAIKGTLNRYDSRQYDTENFGSWYINTLPKFIHDNFGCDIKRKETGSVFLFDREKFASFADIYNHQSESEDSDNDVEIEVSLVQEQDPEGNEGNEGISECVILDIDAAQNKTNAPPGTHRTHRTLSI